MNGLGFFATWLSLATVLNFAQFLAYECSADVTLVGTLALIAILIVFVVYFIFDNVVWPEYLLYMFAPWFVVNYALIGSLVKNWIPGNPSRNNIITICVFFVTLFLAIGKIVMFVLYKTVLKKRIKSYSESLLNYNKVGQLPTTNPEAKNLVDKK